MISSRVDTAHLVDKLDLQPMGDRIRIERAYLDITQKELASRAGIQQRTIALIERGHLHGFSYATFLAIARALDNLSLEYLANGRGPKRFPPPSEQSDVC